MSSNNYSSNPTPNPNNNDANNNSSPLTSTLVGGVIDTVGSAVNQLISLITPFSAVNNDPTATPAVDPSHNHPVSNADPTVNISTPAQPTAPNPLPPQRGGGGKNPKNSSRRSSKDSSSPSDRNNRSKASSRKSTQNNAGNVTGSAPTGPSVVKGDAVQIDAEITRIPAFNASSSSASSIDNNAINVLVTVTAPDVDDSKKLERAPLNLLCVLDRSGSMSGQSKMSSLIETMQFVLDHVSSEDTVSVVSFNDQGFIEAPLRIMNETNRTMAKERVAALRAGGGTCISNGLRNAFQDFDQHKSSTANNSVTAILLLTDGQDTVSFNRNTPIPSSVPTKTQTTNNSSSDEGNEKIDPSDPYSPVLSLAKKINAPIHCFGFGSDHDARVLNHIASKSNGTFTYIENIEQVGDAFAATLGSLTSTITKDMVLRVWVPKPAKRVQPLGRSTVHVDNDPAPDDNTDMMDINDNHNNNNNPDEAMVTRLLNALRGTTETNPNNNGGSNGNNRPRRKRNDLTNDMDMDDDTSTVRIVEEMDPQDQYNDATNSIPPESSSSTVPLVSSTTTITNLPTDSTNTNNPDAMVIDPTGTSSSSSHPLSSSATTVPSSSSSSSSSSTEYPIVGGTMISNVRTAYRSILKADGSELIIHFGALSAGEKRQILLTLRFPDIVLDDSSSSSSSSAASSSSSSLSTAPTNGIQAIDHYALQAMGYYVTLADNQQCSTPLGKLIVSRIHGSNKDEVRKFITTVPKSVDVEAACLRDISTKSMKRALKAADHGDYQRARTTLTTAIEQLTCSPAYTNGNALVRGLADDLTNLQTRVSNSRAMEAGGRAAVLSSVSSHMMQRSSGIATPGMSSSAVYSSRVQTEMMILSPTKQMNRPNRQVPVQHPGHGWGNHRTSPTNRSPTNQMHNSRSPSPPGRTDRHPIPTPQRRPSNSSSSRPVSPPLPPTNNNNSTTTEGNDTTATNDGWMNVSGKPPRRPNRK